MIATPSATADLVHIAEPLRHLAVPVGSLVPDAANARRHDEKNLAAIKASLARWGQRLPLVVQKQGMLVRAGNGRLLAAKDLGWTHVAVLVVDESEVEAVGFAIADNRTGELASWDDEALAKLLESLPDDLAEVAGFTDEDLAELMDGITPDTVEEDDAPPAKETAATRRGDLWLLGEHRLLCGDSTSLDDVRRVMNGEKAALVATDPPYLVDYTGERVGDSGKDWSATYHEIDIKDADGFFRSLFKNVLEVIAPHAAIYCWHAHKRQATIARIWEELGILDHQQVIWLKPSTVFGSVFYHFRHEPCMMGWRQGSKPPHDGDHSINSVWEVDWGGKARVVGNEHPTQKPVELFARPMRKHTKPRAVCFEPFSGSGSQLIAAEQLKRRCYAIELEPVFVEVAIRRWQELTGREATLEEASGGGRTFAEVEAERLSASENAPAPDGDEAEGG